MSLISLKSVKSYQGVNDTSANPSYYTSSFREGLPIKKGQSVQLISFSMNMTGEIVINSLNDTFYIKQGRDPFNASNNQTRYLVKKIVINNGIYTKASLKNALQTAIRGMVIIPDFNNWSVIEKASAGDGEIVFSIQHTRQTYDIFTDYQDNNYSVFDLYNVSGIVSTPTTSNVVVSGNNSALSTFSVNKVADADLSNNYVTSLRFNYLHALMKSERGLFGEGGRVSVVVPKIYKINEFVFSTTDFNDKWNLTTTGLTKPAGAPVSAPDNASNFESALYTQNEAHYRVNFYAMSPQPATFSIGCIKDLELDYSVSGGGTNVPSWFDNDRQEQYIFITNNTNLANPPKPTTDFTTLGCVLRADKLTEQSFLNTSQTAGELWEKFSGFSDINCAGAGTETAFFRPTLTATLTKFKGTITTEFSQYGRVSMGLAQDVLANKPRSLTQFGVENTFTKVAVSNSGGAGGTAGTATSVNQYSDWAFEFLDTTGLEAGLAFKYNQITGTPSSANWRTINNRKSTTDPSAIWTDFVYGTSNIKLEFILSVIGNITYNASHDTDGTKTTFSQVFTEKTTYGNNPAGSLGVDSQLREVKYPLTPMISFAPHDFLQGTPEIAGYYADLKRNAQDLTDGNYISAPLLTTTEFIHTGELGATQKANTTKFTMNFVPASQIVSGKEPSADEILDRDIVNATMGLQNNATAGKSIGYVEPLYTQDPTGSPPPTQSLDGVEIQYNNTTPNIIVEIPELHTSSYNSVNQEKNNAIAFLPSVEFATNQDTGFIHHQSQYDIESDINVPNDIVINQLTAKITDDSGKILSTQLNHPTEMVIQIKDTQRSLMIEQANMINDKIGLDKQVRQDRKFNDMPSYTEI